MDVMNKLNPILFMKINILHVLRFFRRFFYAILGKTTNIDTQTVIVIRLRSPLRIKQILKKANVSYAFDKPKSWKSNYLIDRIRLFHPRHIYIVRKIG